MQSDPSQSKDMQVASDRAASPLDATTLFSDRKGTVPLSRILWHRELVVLLSPVVAPLQDGPQGPLDPFEPLGRAIEARHPWIHHVPYNKQADIRHSHRAFIERARVVIFVVSGPKGRNEPDQWALAEASLSAAGTRPHVVLACYNVQPPELFPAVVQIPSYSPAQLQAVGELLFGENEPGSAIPLRPPPTPQPPLNEKWTVEPWSPPDTPAIYELWLGCLPRQFHLEQQTLASLLDRAGYAMHHIVCDPSSRCILGFCASYVTFADRSAKSLIGSLALVLVREGYRGRGIGTQLHDEALRRLKGVGGVDVLQLGSMFPRLLRGVPRNIGVEELAWFGRRGWDVHRRELISDLLLDFKDFNPGPTTVDIRFYRCGASAELDAVMALVEREAARCHGLGYFDRYAHADPRDIIFGVLGRSVVACALVYLPGSGAPVSEDIPWARNIGDDPDIADKMAVRIQLLETCAKNLKSRGMTGMFVDGVRGGEELPPTGLKTWATYRDAWRVE